jgi:rhodanese-related sulfurtransferase
MPPHSPSQGPCGGILLSMEGMTDALEYFSAKLRHETDASDVYADQKAGESLVVVDVRSEEAWAQGRIQGAVHIPYREIAERAPRELDRGVPVVVYCWSPGCNAGAKGAIEFAKLGYSVREMIGGYEYWMREGQPVENDEGPLPRVFDPQVMVVRVPAVK